MTFVILSIFGKQSYSPTGSLSLKHNKNGSMSRFLLSLLFSTTAIFVIYYVLSDAPPPNFLLDFRDFLNNLI